MNHRILRRSRIAATAAVVAVASVLTSVSTPAHAAPPANDRIADAQTVSVPSTIHTDTREATHSRSDGRCVFGASVWYRLRPTTTGRVRITTIGSDYDTVLTVFEGPRNGRAFLQCSDDAAGLASAVRPRLVKGRTYWIAISRCCRARSHGGAAVLNVFQQSVPPSVSVTVEKVESGAVSGRLLVSGTLTCGTDSVADTYLQVSQRVGDGVARSEDGTYNVLCTPGEPAPWQLRLDSYTGWAFQPGPVLLDLAAQSDDGFSRARYEEELIRDAVDNPGAAPSR